MVDACYTTTMDVTTDVRRVRVGCQFVYVAEIDSPTVFQVEPRNTASVTLAEQGWSSQPWVRVRRYTDLYAIRASGWYSRRAMHAALRRGRTRACLLDHCVMSVGGRAWLVAR
jgi:hypothetical protein